jgi:ribonuclease Z
MVKKLFFFAGGMLLLAMAIGLWSWNSRIGQAWLLEKVVTAAMQRPSPMTQYDGLKVFLCGTSSPLPAPGRAQACVAVLAGESLFLVDAGAGSAQVATLGRLPLERLEAIFLTHFHSDHIAALPEFNLNSWVAGRPGPLSVYGPRGVTQVVDGLNDAYSLDLRYRVAHHGEELLPPNLGVMEPQLMEAGTVLDFDDLTITSFQVNHDPVRPAVGYRFDYRGRSVIISGDATITPGLIDAATGADRKSSSISRITMHTYPILRCSWKKLASSGSHSTTWSRHRRTPCSRRYIPMKRPAAPSLPRTA